ncbi:MAG TPA: ABC transporter permease [Roseiarcus sp.]|jgi:putative spermidine/putrescine transport system permease protein
MATQRPAGYLLITPLGLVLLGVFVAPILLMVPTSLRHYDPGAAAASGWTFENYTQIVTDPYFHGVLARTFTMGALVTLICLVVGYPLAYVLARSTGAARSWLTLLVVFPLLLNIVVRSFGWIALLANHGLLNNALLAMHVVDAPLKLMFNLTGLIIGLTHIFLPFMVLVLVAALQALPRDAEAAAATLGAGPMKTFFLVTLPLTAPGMFAGSVLVFVLTISALVTPRLLGGPAYKVMATVIYDEFLSDLDWPSGAALAFVLTVIALAIVAIASLLTKRWTAAR